jgi:hypothetical protein
MQSLLYILGMATCFKDLTFCHWLAELQYGLECGAAAGMRSVHLTPFAGVCSLWGRFYFNCKQKIACMAKITFIMLGTLILTLTFKS